MEFITLKRNPFPKNRISHKLEEHDILINRYAEVFLAHLAFSTENTREMTIAIASLREIGLENGGTLNEIFRQIEKSGFKPCPANTGLFLRFAWKGKLSCRGRPVCRLTRNMRQIGICLILSFPIIHFRR